MTEKTRIAGHIYKEYGAKIAFLLSDDSGYITGTSGFTRQLSMTGIQCWA